MKKSINDKDDIENTKKKYLQILHGLISEYNAVKTKKEFRLVIKKSINYRKKMKEENPKILNELYDVTVSLINAREDALFRLTGKRHMQV